MIHFKKPFCTILSFLVFWGGPVKAQDTAPLPVFNLPLACTPGTDCWVMNYTDTGPDGDGLGTDPACNARTYEGHKGTDFAIRDEKSMKQGVAVLAARDGKIARVRDGEPDHLAITPTELEKIKQDKKECGNAVLIDHGDGWQTMYCHMKKNSLIVKPDQAIKAGDKIGEVGLSGMTEFPHVHFGVIHKSDVIDPFTGTDIHQACAGAVKSLWAPSLKLAYEPITFFALGFDTVAPSIPAIVRERIDRTALRADASALIFHTVFLGIRANDKITLTIQDPEGRIFAKNEILQDKNKIRQLLYIGRKIRSEKPLKLGVYKGTALVVRTDKDGNTQQFSDERTITVQ